MDYKKVTVVLQPDNELNRTILMAQMGEEGFESFVENEKNLEAYIQNALWNDSIMEALWLNDLFSITWEVETIPDQNWNEVWEKNYFQPLLIADRCLVRAPFHDKFPKAEFELVIEPQMAFGTGNHETTSMMVETILDLNLEGKSILDMGCGTGILAMLASMKGAGSVLAIDIDQWAFESTIENSRLNNCLNITAAQGDASLLSTQTFDVIFANIHKNVLINDMEKYARVLNSGGLLLMSGFYLTDLEDITTKAQLLGLIFQFYHEKNNWIVSVYHK